MTQVLVTKSPFVNNKKLGISIMDQNKHILKQGGSTISGVDTPSADMKPTGREWL